jgi:hypothetical protein
MRTAPLSSSVALLVVATALPACGSRRSDLPDVGPLPDVGLDAPFTVDAANAVDAAPGGDSGARDAAMPLDVGARLDAAARDAGVRDAFAPDAYVPCPDEDLGMATGEGISAGDTSSASARFAAGCAAGEDSPALRFSWTAPSAGSFAIDTYGSIFDTALVVLDGTCSGAELACDDDTGRDLQSMVTIDATAGQSFVIIVTGFDGSASGEYTLSITQPAASEAGLCSNGLDDDRDGFADCDDDDDCGMEPSCTETMCSDGLDDDGDFSIDCEDYDCSTDPACAEKCDDAIDNDLDFLTDCEDSDCDADPACAGLERCANGTDDDGDGDVDCFDDDCLFHPDC